MKLSFNLSTDSYDLLRFRDSDELSAFMTGFDGIELLYTEPDARGVIPPARVTGLHMNCLPCWLDFWNGDEQALIYEFGDLKTCEEYYGGSDRTALIDRYKRELKIARKYGAKYVVFHVSDATTRETPLRKYRHSSAEVTDGACELLNSLFAEESGVTLLLENLWQPGLTFTDPALTRRLSDGVSYRDKGIMLDTGHLLHTNTSLSSQEEAVKYISSLLDIHGGLCSYIKGVHLHQSLTGEYALSASKLPAPEGSYKERSLAAMLYAFAVDRHQPFTCPGVRELIDRISPEFLTFEYITESRDELGRFLKEQRSALGLI